MPNQWNSHSCETSGIDLGTSPTTLFGRLIRKNLYLSVNLFKETLFLCALSANLSQTHICPQISLGKEIMLNFHKKLMDFHFIRFQSKIFLKNGLYAKLRENIKRFMKVLPSSFFCSGDHSRHLKQNSADEIISILYLNEQSIRLFCWQEFLSEKKKLYHLFGWIPHYSVS